MIYKYSDLEGERYISDLEILRNTWSIWCSRMKKRGHPDRVITPENCIQDFVTVNWAIEVKDGTEPK